MWHKTIGIPAFQKFTSRRIAFMKDPHYHLFLLTKEKVRRGFSLLRYTEKSERSVRCLFAGNHRRRSCAPASESGPPSSFPGPHSTCPRPGGPARDCLRAPGLELKYSAHPSARHVLRQRAHRGVTLNVKLGTGKHFNHGAQNKDIRPSFNFGSGDAKKCPHVNEQ